MVVLKEKERQARSARSPVSNSNGKTKVRSRFDQLGSYTGVDYADIYDDPVQDVDDL